mmetsp:Transcript_100973/g.182210  ORF Transcript_100973/g.182210 Transcript_100973/m.182210 type:complete len:323 (-) Transcript_100973:54-1022(-)
MNSADTNEEENAFETYECCEKASERGSDLGEVWELLAGTACVGSDDDSEEGEEGTRPPTREFVPGMGPESLRAAGIAQLPVAREASAALRKLVAWIQQPDCWQLLLNAESGDELRLPPCWTDTPDTDKPWPRWRLQSSKGSGNRLLWLYAGDEAAMEPFETLAAAVGPAGVEAAARPLDAPSNSFPPVQLCSACLVILRSPGAQDSQVFVHRDWDLSVPALPERSAFTVLLPLLMPEGSAGLEVYDQEKSFQGVVAYDANSEEAVAFDNRQPHRTQPGRSPTRILASLSFAPTDPELWAQTECVFRGQTPHFYRSPLCHPAC